MTLNDHKMSFQLPDTSAGPIFRKVQHISPTKLFTTITGATTAFWRKHFSLS